MLSKEANANDGEYVYTEKVSTLKVLKTRKLDLSQSKQHISIRKVFCYTSIYLPNPKMFG